MCNLYTTKASAAEVAAYFRAKMPVSSNVSAGDLCPGGPGLVIREQASERIVQSMTWGFPLAQKSKRTGQPIKPKPVNNIADLTSFMWRFIAARPEHRCIIPMTGFCEAEGEKGAKTRTWFSVSGRPIFAWAGMWKDSPEWGPAYSGLMTDCNEAVRPVHNRMPVLLHEEDHDLWLQGSLDDVMSFQARCFPDELIGMERTRDPWLRPRVEAISFLSTDGREGAIDAESTVGISTGFPSDVRRLLRLTCFRSASAARVVERAAPRGFLTR